MPHDDNGDTKDGGSEATGHHRVFSLIGHNSEISDEEHEAKFERWSKKRTFVRALEGTYSHLVEELFTQPRVYSTSDLDWPSSNTPMNKVSVTAK